MPTRACVKFTPVPTFIVKVFDVYAMEDVMSCTVNDRPPVVMLS